MIQTERWDKKERWPGAINISEIRHTIDRFRVGGSMLRYHFVYRYNRVHDEPMTERIRRDDTLRLVDYDGN